jgi:hypothetical protein
MPWHTESWIFILECTLIAYLKNVDEGQHIWLFMSDVAFSSSCFNISPLMLI